MNKIRETADIISHLARSSKTSLNGSRKSANVITTTSTSSMSTGPNSQSAIVTKTHNKFKTGGIVATAVQPSKKSKKTRNIPPAPLASKSLDAVNFSESEAENIKFCVKKYKTKKKLLKDTKISKSKL